MSALQTTLANASVAVRTVLYIAATAACGFALRRRKLLTAESAGTLSQLLFWVLAPALILRAVGDSVAGGGESGGAILLMTVASGLNLARNAALGWAVAGFGQLKTARQGRWTEIVLVMHSNNGFLPIALLVAVASLSQAAGLDPGDPGTHRLLGGTLGSLDALLALH